jgi:UDP-N-acetyl-D-glucosamine dehydrogenase
VKNTALLRRRILSRRAVVGVVGQDYMGRALSSAAAMAGFPVTGIDGDDSFAQPDLSEAFSSGKLTVTRDSKPLVACDVICICAPTPMRDQRPDSAPLHAACAEVAKHLAPGRLVIVESSTCPGATEHEVKPLLEKSGLSAGHDFLLACSPERIDQGSDEYGLRNTPRVIGGLTPEATGLAALFYEQLVDKVVAVSSCRVAELAKLLESTFRHVNVALVNEMAVLCHDVGIEVWEVLEAASSKPFGFMPFIPGPGVGGQTVWLDPAELSSQPRQNGARQLRMLEQAQDINGHMPGYVASRIGDALNERGQAVKGASLFVLGVSYKEDVGDLRESPALKVIASLQRSGARVSFHDPHVPVLIVDQKVRERTELTQRAVARADCVALLTPHRAYDLEWIARHANLIFDARNAYGSRRPANVIAL